MVLSTGWIVSIVISSLIFVLFSALLYKRLISEPVKAVHREPVLGVGHLIQM